MKPVENQLDRLMKAAAKMPQPPVGEAPFTMQARVLAHWRGARESGNDFLVAWFRRAAIAACIMTIGCLAWTYFQQSNPSGGEVAVATSAMNMGVEP